MDNEYITNTTTEEEIITDEVSEPVEAVDVELMEAPETGCSAPKMLLGAAVVGGIIAGGVVLFKKGKAWWKARKEKKAAEAAKTEEAEVTEIHEVTE